MSEQFDNSYNRIKAKVDAALVSKGKQYATENRYHNFEVAAAFDGCSRREALWGMWRKHLVSVLDLIKGRKSFDLELTDEKFVDLICYAYLCRGMIEEEEA